MKLLSCHIENYGKFSKKDFEFNKDVTAFCEDNGYGKSTLASFLKAMFFGLETDRASSGFNERRHFCPFEGGNFGGYLILTMRGKEYKIERINPITYNYGEEVSSKAFKVVHEPKENDTIFQKEHYVVISKKKDLIFDIKELKDRNIGVIAEDESVITKYLQDASIEIHSYESSTKLFETLSNADEIEFAIIPLDEHLTTILSSNYYIDYHISDLNKYFVFEPKEEDMFSSIIKKYFAVWKEENLEKSINENELKTFVNALSISEKEITNIQSKVYNYGFVDKNPYEVLISGSYGGIVSEYIAEFSAFSQTEFSFTKYKNFNKFAESIATNQLDMYFNFYSLDTDYKKIDSLMNVSFVVVAPSSDNLLINSLSSLKEKTIYVEKNSLLETYLSTWSGLEIKTYGNEKDLKKIIKKENYIVMDKDTFIYYQKSLLANYNIRFESTLSETYNFYVKNDDTFLLLFNKYITTLDPAEVRVKGLHNHEVTVKSGTLLGTIAKYSLIVVVIILIIIFIIYRSTKKIKIAKKIKKEDKIKYIDQLTSLKNRNYLNENIANWNKNTIYPQATIIIDLNQLQMINDTLGYEQGDIQIKAAANVLIKTQLDNTDIMRTDGNEYLIYMVGYQEKQVVSYIRKLYKEFKNLPYKHGASIGYSMITSDIKTIEDAINESIEDMKSKKEELDNENEEKN